MVLVNILTDCRRVAHNKRHRAYCKRNKGRLAVINKKAGSKYISKIKAKVIALYGGECTYCGLSDPRMLCLDHIDNNGGEERRRVRESKKTGSGYHFYTHLLRIPRRPDLQVLCWNHNWLKKACGGVLPPFAETG